jgi:hypothetical protein
MGSRGSELAGYPGCASLAIEGRVNSNCHGQFPIFPVHPASAWQIGKGQWTIDNEKSI